MDSIQSDGNVRESTSQEEHSFERLLERERAVKKMLASLNLDASKLSDAVRKRLDKACKELVELNVTQVNRPNIYAAHVTKTLNFQADLNRKAQLQLAKSTIDNLNASALAMMSLNEKGIKVIKNDMDQMTAELSEVVGPTPLSPENVLNGTSYTDVEKRKLQQKIMFLSRLIVEREDELKKRREELKQFRGLPPDIDAASHILTLKTRELEELTKRLGQ